MLVTEEGVHYKVKCPNDAFLIALLSPSLVSTAAATVLHLFFCSLGKCALGTPPAKLPPPLPASKSVLSKTKHSPRPNHDSWVLIHRATCFYKNLEQKVLTFYSSFPLLPNGLPSISAIHAHSPCCLWLTQILAPSASISNTLPPGNLSIRPFS